MASPYKTPTEFCQMKRMNQFLRATIVLCGLAAGVLATVYNPAPAAAQEKKCYYCECEKTCVCIETKCQSTVVSPT
jgi:hypothetical protein